jgi:hypothetical protein
MAAINFPDSPNVNDIFSVGTVSWQWNGAVWKAIPALGYTGSRGYNGSSGAYAAVGYTGSVGVGYTGSRGDVSKAFAIAMAVGLS